MKTLNKNTPLPRERVLWRLIAGHWQKLLLAMVCMLVVAAATSASAYLVKPMLDDIFVNRDRSRLMLLPGAAILIFFSKGGCHLRSSVLDEPCGTANYKDPSKYAL